MKEDHTKMLSLRYFLCFDFRSIVIKVEFNASYRMLEDGVSGLFSGYRSPTTWRRLWRDIGASSSTYASDGQGPWAPSACTVPANLTLLRTHRVPLPQMGRSEVENPYSPGTSSYYSSHAWTTLWAVPRRPPDSQLTRRKNHRLYMTRKNRTDYSTACLHGRDHHVFESGRRSIETASGDTEPTDQVCGLRCHRPRLFILSWGRQG